MNKSQPKNFVEFPFKYKEEIILDICDVSNLGIGVGKINDWVVFVPYALMGEKIKASVYRNKKNYSEADLVEVLEPSPERAEPFCKLFGVCGGCQYQHLTYAAQLKLKQKQIGDLMKHIAKLEVSVEPTHPSPEVLGYRSKLTPHYNKPLKDGSMPVGFIMQSRRQTLVDVPSCPIASKAINEALPKARQNIIDKACKLKRGGTILLRDTLTGVVSDNNAVVKAKVGEFTYNFIAGDFFQNNPFILPEFVGYIVNEALGNKYLVDAYCGVGLFAIAAHKHFEKVAAIEISEKAINCAEENKKINNALNCEFTLGSSEEIFKNIAFKGSESSMIIDPPRSGCSEEFLQQLVNFAPKKLVYVSCGPDTQARDLIFLTANGYKVEKIQPFDMFPQTRHIESVATLSKI